jgi:hypothetical protein
MHSDFDRVAVRCKLAEGPFIDPGSLLRSAPE